MYEHDTSFVPTDELAQRVFNLSADKFLAVYRLYEKLGRQASVGQEMQVLRQRLRRLRPRRAPTFTRVLCLPFEEFITDSPVPGPYLIPRKHCHLLGRFVKSLLDPEEVEALTTSIASLPAEDVDAMLRAGKRLWHLAARALRGARVAKSRGQGDLRDSLELIVGCLEVGPQMSDLTLRLPRDRFRHLDDKALKHVARALRSVPDTRGKLLLYPLVLISLRLETPPAVVAMLQDKRLEIGSALRNRLIQMMTRYLELDLQAEVRIVEDIAENGHFDTSSELLEALLPSILKARANRSVGVSALPADVVLKTAGGLVREQVVKPSPAAITDCLSSMLDATGDESTPETEQLTPSELRRRNFSRLEEELEILTGLSKQSDSLGLHLDVRRATEEARTRIANAGETLLDRMTVAAPDADLELHKLDIYGVVRLIEILEGPDKADQLRLRCDGLLEAA